MGKKTDKTPEIEKTQEKKTHSNIFLKIGNIIENIRETMKYKLPNSDEVVNLVGGKEIQEMKKGRFIDEKIFRLQIGKMQSDGNTIYSQIMLQFGIDYIAKHIKLDKNGKGKAVIQLWPDLAKLLLQEDKEILSFEDEKKEIERLIKKTLGKKCKNIEIEIQNVADNYQNVFKVLKNGKNGIIPKSEPKLNLKSPLSIIKYLAYHYQKDTNLGKLFYSTKPKRYEKLDGENHIPGTSDADFYPVVEVGIRLYEVLNGITMQGGIGRQRVYDKIISLILFGEDKIGKSGEYGINKVLTLNDYPSLVKLHGYINKRYKDIKMQQLYIELNEKSLAKIQSKYNKKNRIKRALEKFGIASGIAATLVGVGLNINGIKKDKEEEYIKQKKELYLSKCGKESPLSQMPLSVLDGMRKYQQEQHNILRSEYDISRYDTKYHNKILEEYDKAFDANYELYQSWLSARDFIKANRKKLAKDYNFFPDNLDENPKKDENK